MDDSAHRSVRKRKRREKESQRPLNTTDSEAALRREVETILDEVDFDDLDNDLLNFVNEHVDVSQQCSKVESSGVEEWLELDIDNDLLYRLKQIIGIFTRLNIREYNEKDICLITQKNKSFFLKTYVNHCNYYSSRNFYRVKSQSYF